MRRCRVLLAIAVSLLLLPLTVPPTAAAPGPNGPGAAPARLGVPAVQGRPPGNWSSGPAYQPRPRAKPAGSPTASAARPGGARPGTGGRGGGARLAAAFPPEVEQDHPAAWWRLGETSGATTAVDVSGNLRHGTYAGGVSYGRPGALYGDSDTAVGFAGTGTYVSASVPGLPTSSGSDVTVELWMRWDGSSATQMPFGFFNRYDLLLDQGFFGFNTGQTDLWGISSAGLANRWVHVVGVFRNGDAKQSKLYVDGKLQTLSQRFGTTGNATVSAPVRISGWAADDAYAFHGDLDEVAVYPTELPAARVSAHHQAGLSPYAAAVRQDQPSTFWRLGEAAGATTAVDVSGNFLMAPMRVG
jgi:Concanavalin A-like lectin/glucanases superfamily